MSDSQTIPGSQPGPAEPSSFLTPFLENGAGPGSPIGTPVTGNPSSDDTVSPAEANAVGTSYVLGLLKRPQLNGERTLVQTRGPLTLTPAQWLAIAGTSGLTRGPYYLSPTTPGQIQPAIPSGGGQFAILVGYAITTTTLVIAGLPVLPVPEASA
jgi:hypothetical protein